MSVRAFVDTNVLVYAIEGADRHARKREAARTLLRHATIYLSTQVLGEFYRAVTSPRRECPLTPDEAVAWVQLWKKHIVSGISVPHVDLALEICRRYQINYFDALILSAARMAHCRIVYSEDLTSGQDYGGVTVENPFHGL
jgi:predicted nucleic acid-binding protein